MHDDTRPLRRSPTTKTICLCGDDATRLQDFTSILREAGYRTCSLAHAVELDVRPDLVLVDLPRGEEDAAAAAWARALTTLIDGGPPFVGLGSRSEARRLEGAPGVRWAQLLPRAAASDALLAALRGALSAAPGQAPFGADFVIGRSRAMARLCEEILLVADRSATVLLTGATGVGKERVARAIHQSGPRSTRPFVAVNCAGIPAGLLEDEFFGHVKGSFTGAHAGRSGRFLQADGGTLFLDEVGELPLELQPKLLRVLQEREVTPVGAAQPIQVDVRIIAATNVALSERVAFGSFRQDLFYRLNVFPIAAPPLAERLEDIPDLAEHFCRACCRREGITPKTLTTEAAAALVVRPWPGNVRELQNAVESAVIRAKGRRELLARDFDLESPFDPPASGAGRDRSAHAPRLAEPGAFNRLVASFERSLILNALARAKGNKAEAARALGLRRTTLVEKLKRLEGKPDAR